MTASILGAGTSQLDIRPFDFTGASDYEYEVLNRHLNRFRAESEPDDPPRPLEEMMAQARNVPPNMSANFWAGWNAAGDEILASASAIFITTDDNNHIGNFMISVDPPLRSQGVGRELLRLVAESAKREGRRLLMTDTNGRVPSGEAFMKRVGGEHGLVCTSSQLALADLDAALVESWVAEGKNRATGITLGFWDGPYPADHLAAIASLIEVMNTQPRDSLDVEDARITVEELQQGEHGLAATGTQRWTVYASDTETGRYVGSTEVYWNPNRPEIINQGMTGVFPEFRGKGLGRTLKAAMLERILRDRPQARFVRTDNADSNAAVLGINGSLGYKPYSSRCIWQLETNKALAYLEG